MEKNVMDFLANPIPPRAAESNQPVVHIPPDVCSPEQSVAAEQQSPRPTATWVCILDLPPHTDARPGVGSLRASADLTVLSYKMNNNQSAFPVGWLRGLHELRDMNSVSDTVMSRAWSEERGPDLGHPSQGRGWAIHQGSPPQ